MIVKTGHIITMLHFAWYVILPVKHVQQPEVAAVPHANRHKTELNQVLHAHAQRDIMKYQIQVLVY